MEQARDCVDLQEIVDIDIMLVYLQVRAEITSKEKEEEDMIEKVTKEVKYVYSYFPRSSSLFSHSIERYFYPERALQCPHSREINLYSFLQERD